MSNTNEQQLAPVGIGQFGIQLTNFSEAARFAELVYNSGLAPKELNSTAKVLVTMQLGMELGLPPMASLTGTCVINGRPSIFGDNMPGLIMSRGVLEDFEEYYEIRGVRIDDAPDKPTAGLAAVCMVKRVGKRPVIRKFSWEMAIQGGLSTKSGPWQSNPMRMLQMRARSFALRDVFPDVLRGLITVEEARDITPRPGGPPDVEAPGTPTLESMINPATPPERTRRRRRETVVEATVSTPEPDPVPEEMTEETMPVPEKNTNEEGQLL